MKTYLRFKYVFVLTTLLMAWMPSAHVMANDVAIDATNFPDENFRNYLLEQDYGQDGMLTQEEIAVIRDIWVSNKGISDLTGIKYFTALTSLFCDNNQLISLDVSKCTELTYINCLNNQLTSLDVSGCTALTVLYCYDNQLNSLNVSGCIALEHLGCINNQLTSLDVSGCTALTNFDCNHNQLTSLDMSGCTALTALYCDNNLLTSLDVSGCTALTTIDCWSNQLTSLDVSGCTALTYLNCRSNQLTSLDVSGCTALTTIDSWSNQLTSLDVSGCTALTALYCDNNLLTSLDVSGCTALTTIDCWSNQLTSLDVSGCTALTYLNCRSNQLTSLDVSGCTMLTNLDCTINMIKGEMMDVLVSSLPTVEAGELYVLFSIEWGEGNECTPVQVTVANAKGWKAYQLDVSTFDWVEMEGEAQTSTDIAIDATNFPDENFRNYLLSQNYGQDGVLTKEEIAGIDYMDVGEREISDLTGIKYFTALTYLNCYSNKLTSLDVSGCFVLE